MTAPDPALRIKRSLALEQAQDFKLSLHTGRMIYMVKIAPELQLLLEHHGQLHLTQFWSECSDEQRAALVQQIQQVDFALVKSLWKEAAASSSDAGDSSTRIDRAQAPAAVIRQPVSAESKEAWHKAAILGEAELAAGRVAVITVAGGQGTRLGFEHPKGMFPVGPVSDRSLFQIFAEQIQARRVRHQASIPWFIMTSEATHEETVQFFSDNQHFGLSEGTVAFFKQGSLPAIDAATGGVLMNGKCDLALSPDGHGGLITALDRSGLLQLMEREGIQHLFYHQVDNPTVIIADPALIGFHLQQGSMLTTNVVCKTSPTERMGVLVDIDGRTEIIEYSELTPEQSAKHDDSGQWIFWAGNTAIHLFDRSFLKQMATDGCRLPLHIARKNVPFVDSNGKMVAPSDPANPNAFKMERFIFDALPLAEKTLIVEGNREREFNPVKNRTGADSPETSRAALLRIAQEWLSFAGHAVPAETPVEISPLVALDAEELMEKFNKGEVTMQHFIR